MAKQYISPEMEIVEVDANDGNKYSLPYGIAKGLGLDTTGMRPREVWEMLKGRGITPENEYEKLKEKAQKQLPKEKVDTIDPKRDIYKKTITQSKAFSTLSNTAKEKLERNLDKLSSEQLSIISKYSDRLYQFANGSGQYSTGGGYIRFDQGSNGKGLAKELGYDFDACTFYHEYGHFVDNMQGKDKTGYNIKYDSTTVNVHEDALNCFNDLIKIGGGAAPVKNMNRIMRAQYQAFYRGLAEVTGRNQLWKDKSKTEFGYIREPYKPTYTVEQAVRYFGESARQNSERLWKEYEEWIVKWKTAESDGTNANAAQKLKEYREKMEEHNRPIENNIERFGILTDFFGLYTNNKVNLHKNGYWGHGGSYNKWHNVQEEAWAEYFSFKMTNDTKGLDIMKKYLPKTYVAFEQKYNDIKEK